MATATADKIEKLRRLYVGGATPGERAAAKAALDRLGVPANEPPRAKAEQSSFIFTDPGFWKARFEEAMKREAAQREREAAVHVVELAFADALERQLAIAACKRNDLIPRQRKIAPKGRRKSKVVRREKKIIARGPESKIRAAGTWYAAHITALRKVMKAFKMGCVDEMSRNYSRDLSECDEGFESAYYYGTSTGLHEKNKI